MALLDPKPPHLNLAQANLTNNVDAPVLLPRATDYRSVFKNTTSYPLSNPLNSYQVIQQHAPQSILDQSLRSPGVISWTPVIHWAHFAREGTKARGILAQLGTEHDNLFPGFDVSGIILIANKQLYWSTDSSQPEPKDGHISTGDGVFGFDNVGKKQTRPYYLAEDTSRKQSVLALRPRRDFIQDVKERSKQLTSGQRPPTFSKQGQEYEVTLQHGTYSQWLWCPQEFPVHYSPNYNRVPRFDVNRYLMRRAPNGPVTERVEPNPPIPIHVTSNATEGKHDNIRIGEALYNRFQVEKYRLYWSLPTESIPALFVPTCDAGRGRSTP
ncbi:hypothetical protein CPB85DRAFT_1435988 [Mucidula mucida]|nr:hypothetical protein CPB85DRAFT_1435988 [Mucidula mucida]